MSVGHPSPIWRGVGGEVIKWKGFTFFKGETFLVTGGFPEGFGEKWKPIYNSPIPVPSSARLRRELSRTLTEKGAEVPWFVD